MIFIASRRTMRAAQLLAMALAFAPFVPSLQAQVVIAPVKPVVGSGNTVSADPRVAVPNTKSCTVTLFTAMEFDNYNVNPYNYAPPTACHGPWAKVVFSADFTVTAGVQFDRTGQFYLGGANIYFGTTAEPAGNLSPSWHVERDVTDLSALLATPQTGTAILGNTVNSTYTGIVYANAHLTFYEASWQAPAPAVPSLVVGLPGDSGAAILNTSSSVYTQAITFPTNVTSAYLDVIAQSQIGDEFWYTCVPNNLTTELESCGNTGFRETEITIDGVPAGVAPVYPWIYTGGFDPYLWAPLPGVQTLNLVPYRVDLTPFAAELSNGKTHTVGIQVYNANGYFQAAANLLVFTDPFLKKVTGGLDSNTLAAEPDPTITNNLKTDASGDVTGAVKTVSNRKYSIAGWVNTFLGPVKTTVNRTVDFTQTATFDLTDSVYVQDVAQTTQVVGDTATDIDGFTLHQTSNYTYPFSFDYAYTVNTDGSSYQTVKVNQLDQVKTSEGLGGPLSYGTTLSNQVIAQDTLNFDASGNFTGNTANSSSQNYVSTDLLGGCYSEKLTSAAGILTSAVSGTGCKPR
jgi:hypothetical protein